LIHALRNGFCRSTSSSRARTRCCHSTLSFPRSCNCTSNICRRGSVGLKVSLIASRECDIYIHPSPRTKLWDTCAPQAILEEAGGKLTDLFGREIQYDRRDVQNWDGVVASNGASHAAAIKHLRPLLAEFGRVPHFSSSLAA